MKKSDLKFDFSMLIDYNEIFDTFFGPIISYLLNEDFAEEKELQNGTKTNAQKGIV